MKIFSYILTCVIEIKDTNLKRWDKVKTHITIFPLSIFQEV